jgi:hypothetical protein
VREKGAAFLKNSSPSVVVGHRGPSGKMTPPAPQKRAAGHSPRLKGDQAKWEGITDYSRNGLLVGGKRIPLAEHKMPSHEPAVLLPAQAGAEERNSLKNKDVICGHDILYFFLTTETDDV